MRILPIHSGLNLEQQIKALRSIHESKNQIFDNAVENMGGIAVQSQMFQRQAEPITRPIVSELRAMRGQPAAPAPPRSQAPLPSAPPPASRPAPPPPPTAPPTAAPPAGPSTPPRASPPAGPSTPVSPSGEIIHAIRKMAATLGPITRDLSLISLNLTSGSFTVNKRPVSASLTPLEIEGHVVTPDLAQLLLGGKGGQWPTDFLANVTSTGMKAYRQILASKGIGDAEMQRSEKGRSLIPITGKGLRTRKPPKSTSARVQPDGRWGDLVVDIPLLRGSGILRISDPTNGKDVFREPASSGLKHLLLHRATKRQAGAGLYGPGDVAAYRRIAQLARAPVPKKNNRRLLAEKPGVAEAIFIPDDVASMSERLEILRAAKRAGDKSERLINEGVALSDRLLKKRELSKREHEEIVRELLAQI